MLPKAGSVPVVLCISLGSVESFLMSNLDMRHSMGLTSRSESSPQRPSPTGPAPGVSCKRDRELHNSWVNSGPRIQRQNPVISETVCWWSPGCQPPALKRHPDLRLSCKATRASVSLLDIATGASLPVASQSRGWVAPGQRGELQGPGATVDAYYRTRASVRLYYVRYSLRGSPLCQGATHPECAVL